MDMLAAISNDISSSSSGIATTNIVKSIATEAITSDYHVEILQEPLQARMTGLGDILSKRMLDPPLVLQVNTRTKNPSPVTLFNISRQLVCRVTLYHHCLNKDMSYLCISAKTLKSSTMQLDHHTDYLVPALLGTCIKNSQIMNPMNCDQWKNLFVFSDLCVRIQGEFRLKVSVINVMSGRCDTFLTNVFHIYSPQYYPGILEPTELSKWLYEAGIPIKSGFHSNKLKRVGAKGLLLEQVAKFKSQRKPSQRKSENFDLLIQENKTDEKKIKKNPSSDSADNRR